MLCDKTWPNWVGMPKEGVKELFKVLYSAVITHSDFHQNIALVEYLVRSYGMNVGDWARFFLIV